MILRWKVTSSTERVAQWQGMALLLRYEPTSPPWRVYVDGCYVNTITKGGPVAAWWTDKAAMEAVDVIVNKQIKEQGLLVKAIQKERTPLRLIYGGAHAR